MCNEPRSSAENLDPSTITEAGTEKRVQPERGVHPATFVLNELPIPAKKFLFTLNQDIEISLYKNLDETKKLCQEETGCVHSVP